MIAPTQIRKPKNWQDFEKLCKKLWGEVWNCSASIKCNGRSGQEQYGVDIYGIPKGETSYHGIQCKGKDEYSKSKLSKLEIDAEIAKAIKFKPSLKELIFTTTADKDVAIEQYIREKNVEHINQGIFSLDVFSWGDIVDLLEEYRSTYNWFINNCQYKDATDFDVLISGKKELEIHPQYYRIAKKYIRKEKPYIPPFMEELYKQHPHLNLQPKQIPAYQNFNPLYRPPSKIDYRWCTFPITIKNIGSTVIEDYKVYFQFEPETTDGIDDKFRIFDPGLLHDALLVKTENIERKKQREIFESSEYSNVVEYRPLKPILVQDDHKTFKVGVKPKDSANEIVVKWVIKSRDYKKEGEFVLKVTPFYEDLEEIINIEHDAEDVEDEVIIEPKIV